MILHFKLRSLALTETFILEQFKAIPEKNLVFAHLFRAQDERQTQAKIWCFGPGSYLLKFFDFTSEIRLIHVHFGSNAIFALPLLIRFSVPMIISFYGHDASSFLLKWPNLIRFVCRYASKILVLTKTMSQNLIDLGVDSRKIEVFHPGIPDTKIPKRRKRGDGPLRLLMASSLREKKNHRLVLKALSSLGKKKVELRIAGTGPLDEELKVLAHQLNLNVEFTGAFVSDEERQNHFLWADVLLHPSRAAKDGDSEGLPFLILEAMQAGLPVITSRHAGMDLEFQDSCFYVSESDENDLTKLISDWDWNLACEKIEKAKHLIKVRFSQDKNLKHLRKIYKSLAANLVLPD